MTSFLALICALLPLGDDCLQVHFILGDLYQILLLLYNYGTGLTTDFYLVVYIINVCEYRFFVF